MTRILPVLAYLALVVYALVDVIQSDDDDIGGIPKGLSVVVILFLPLVGSIAWIVVSRTARGRRREPAQQTGFPAGPVPPAQYPGRRRTWEDSPGSADPDDDPEMRWLLEQARLKRERGQGPRSGAPGRDPVDRAIDEAADEAVDEA